MLVSRYGHNLFTPLNDTWACMHMDTQTDAWKNNTYAAVMKRQGLPHATAMIGFESRADHRGSEVQRDA
jgi:hypothetical protein